MKPETDMFDEWADLQSVWQVQAAVAPDLPGLRREVERRLRRMRVVCALEVLVAFVALGNCTRALLMHDRVPLPVPMIIAFMALILGYTSWALWQRRRQWLAVALAPHALIEFERARTLTSLRIWRVSTWLALGVWIALTVNAIHAMQNGPVRLPAYTWLIVVGLNAWVVLASAALGWWLGRRRRQRLRRLQAMQQELQAN